ncbi:MAG: phosphoglycolate phosphatase-like HAD superfamily hydrolase [Planctomycetota bacterium]|jgi:phosphoglycolate phosphatase-like HAD superfamily hydrolase
MPLPDLYFDAVLFDLDGTLVATDRFWPDAARAGALKAFEALGIEREVPTAAEWMSMVGLPLDEGFDRVFTDLTAQQRKVVLDACVVEEHRLLDEGRSGLLPGTVQALEELHRRGVRMGIASNCSQAYLDAMFVGMGLNRWIEEARCLDSPRIGNKADMLEDLLLTFDTRSAVMVGDRAGDRDSAWANGLPHIHLSRGYAQAGEQVQAEATLAGLDELVPLLVRRQERVVAVLKELDLPQQACVLGVGGPPGVGKSLWTRDLGRALEAAGRSVRRLDLEDFALGEEPLKLDPGADPGAVFEASYALESFLEAIKADSAVSGEVLLVEGRYLNHVPLAAVLERLLWLEGPDQTLLRRIVGRDGRLRGPAPVASVKDRSLPLARALEHQQAPSEVASLVISGANPLD